MPHSEPSQDGTEGGLSTPVGSRRTFFGWVTAAAAGLVGIGLGVPLIGALISPAFRRRARDWVDVGAASDVPVGRPVQLDHVTMLRDGWLQSKSHKAVWAVKGAAEDITVFSPICTHLGCGYRWDDGERKFLCPCHGSAYDIEGRVLAGPAPRPLDRLPAKIENGRLLVTYKEFKAGLPKSVDL
ncbi:MAG: ubiquinol-cytochrome c reductase iron-sulfur subunit [Nitrospiraceae bacterium]|nr:ubiquinol-cytochrome c reductase iron-sulfur subunit [Nitrospiraceae bacterium]